MLGIHREHPGILQILPFDLGCSFSHHALSQVNPDYLSVRANRACCWKEISASSSSDIQHVRAFLQAEAFDEMLPSIVVDARPDASISRRNARIQIDNVLFLPVVIAH